LEFRWLEETDTTENVDSYSTTQKESNKPIAASLDEGPMTTPVPKAPAQPLVTPDKDRSSRNHHCTSMHPSARAQEMRTYALIKRDSVGVN
jgi:hypothetical protein